MKDIKEKTMKHETKLTKNEKAIESALLMGEYVDINKIDLDAITTAIKNSNLCFGVKTQYFCL